MFTQKLFESQFLKKEVSDTPHKPLLYNFLLEDFENENQKTKTHLIFDNNKSKNTNIPFKLYKKYFYKKKNLNNQSNELISTDNESSFDSNNNKSKCEIRKKTTKIEKQLSKNKISKKNCYCRKSKIKTNAKKCKSINKINQSKKYLTIKEKNKIELSSFLKRKNYVIKNKVIQDLKNESLSDSASIVNEEEENNKDDNNLNISILCYEFDKIDLSQKDSFTQYEIKISSIKIEQIILLKKDKLIGIFKFENENEEKDYGKLFPLVKDNNNEDFYNIINDMKKTNKFYLCELNKIIINYKCLYSPIFFLNKVINSK